MSVEMPGPLEPAIIANDTEAIGQNMSADWTIIGTEGSMSDKEAAGLIRGPGSLWLGFKAALQKYK